MRLEHKFDWYQASVPVTSEAIHQQLLASMPGGTVVADGKGMYSFTNAKHYGLPDGEIAVTMMHGGVNPHPNVKASGDFSPSLAQLIRHYWPQHRVSRLDVAIDMRGDGVFDQVVRIMSAVGREFRLRGNKWLPDDLDEGSTYYLGGEQSALRVRCYEKGKQLFKLTGDPCWRELFDWTRLELQVRPEKAFKSTAASMPPEAFWGCSTWTRDLAAHTLALNPAPVEMKPARLADHERAMRYAVQQYGPTFLRQISKLGSWEAFCADLHVRMGLDQPDQAAA